MAMNVTVARTEDLDRAQVLVEKVAGELRSDQTWSASLVDGPNVLGVESLHATETKFRVDARAAPGRRDDVERELQQRIRKAFAQENLALVAVEPQD